MVDLKMRSQKWRTFSSGRSHLRYQFSPSHRLRSFLRWRIFAHLLINFFCMKSISLVRTKRGKDLYHGVQVNLCRSTPVHLLCFDESNSPDRRSAQHKKCRNPRVCRNSPGCGVNDVKRRSNRERILPATPCEFSDHPLRWSE